MSTARVASVVVTACTVALSPRAAGAIPSVSVAAAALPSAFARELFGAAAPPVAALLPDGAVGFFTPEIHFAQQTSTVGTSFFTSLDRSRTLSFARAASQRYSLDGRGVLVGVVDTGLDLLHGDFRAPDGSSRAVWVLDYTQSPVGLHPELERRFSLAFDGALLGAVWSAGDLDRSLRLGSPPTDDSDGHGSFVASIAAGNGRSTSPPRYIGIAPESSLVIVRAGRSERQPITDAAVLAGVAFIFDRADSLGLPAVVNLSVGSHDGAHDGDSVFERSLGSLCPPDHPGRAIVASAGNDAQRPIHSRLSLSAGVETPLGLWLPAAPSEGRARLVGIALSSRAQLSLSVRLPDGSQTPWVSSRSSAAYRLSGAFVSIANGTDGASWRTGSRTTDLLIASGQRVALRPGGVWSLILRGSGRADAYIFRDDGEGSARAAFMSGLSRATVTLPASSEYVISVGALSTRPSLTLGPATTEVAPFSARGPCLDGSLRPDLVAPGDMVFAARAHSPRSDPFSMFSERARLALEGEHIGASGTSAAAPHVTGAVALLFQQDPSLTPREISSVLTASARPVATSPRWNPSEAYGALDVQSAIELARALRGTASGAPIDPAECSVTLAEPAIAPGESTQLSVILLSHGGSPALGEHSVTVTASAGRASPARPLGAGRYSIGYTAEGLDAPAAVTLRVRADGVSLGSLSIVVTREGLLARGGCDIHRPKPSDFTALSCVFLTAFARRARSSARVSAPAGRGRR